MRAWGVGSPGAASSSEERGALGFREAEGAGEQVRGFAVRVRALAALQIADGASADVRAFGQLLLSEAASAAVAPQEITEHRSFSKHGVIRNSDAPVQSPGLA